jgi:hypothetical protein
MFDFRESLRMMLQFTFCFQHFIDSHSKSCPFRKVEHQTKVGKYELLHEGEPDKSKSRCTRVSCDFHSLLYCPIHYLYTGTRFFQWPCNGDCAGTVLSPSIVTFEKLHAIYSNTLSCTCQQIAIPYGSFVTIKPIFHQVSHIH